MAKKATSKSTFGFDKISEMIEGISKKTSVIIENDSKETTYINTKIHVLNALLSKSIIKGGISKNRITVFAGPPQCGKSFLCYNIASEAQKLNYNVIYIDTEYSIEKTELQKFGVDTGKNFMLVRTNKVEDLKILLSQVLDELKTQKQDGKDIGNTIIFLDSIGQLASKKEVEDAVDGKVKADMTRAKAIKSLFRIINSDLGYLEIPLVATNHIYMSQDLFPQAIMGGGEGVMYSASSVVFMSPAKLKTGEESTDAKARVKDIGQSGIIVTAKAKKNRLAKPMQVKFEINHTRGVNPYVGLEVFCTPENFEKVGIAKVKVKTDKGKIKEVTPGGTKYYVRHLDKSFYEKQLFTDEIFTPKVLEALDSIIQDYFSYKSNEEQSSSLVEMEKLGGDFNIDEDNDAALFDK
jgi:RecA/RadA recombinase